MSLKRFKRNCGMTESYFPTNTTKNISYIIYLLSRKLFDPANVELIEPVLGYKRKTTPLLGL